MLRAAGSAMPNDDILFVTDSNGFSGFRADGTSGYDPTGLDAPNILCREARNEFQNTATRYTTTAADPLAFNNTTFNNSLSSYTGAVSCGLSFLKWYAANRLVSGRRVRGTFVGIGGTTLASWVSGGGAAPTAYTRINATTGDHASNALVLIVGILGTNDAISGTSRTANDANLTTFCTNYRNPSNVTLATSSTPIIFTACIPSWVASSPYVNDAATGTRGGVDTSLRNIGSLISKTACVDMTGLTGQTGTGSPFHFTDSDQRTIGGTGIGTAWANLSA